MQMHRRSVWAGAASSHTPVLRPSAAAGRDTRWGRGDKAARVGAQRSLKAYKDGHSVPPSRVEVGRGLCAWLFQWS